MTSKNRLFGKLSSTFGTQLNKTERDKQAKKVSMKESIGCLCSVFAAWNQTFQGISVNKLITEGNPNRPYRPKMIANRLLKVKSKGNTGIKRALGRGK